MNGWLIIYFSAVIIILYWNCVHCLNVAKHVILAIRQQNSIYNIHNGHRLWISKMYELFPCLCIIIRNERDNEQSQALDWNFHIFWMSWTDIGRDPYPVLKWLQIQANRISSWCKIMSFSWMKSCTKYEQTQYSQAKGIRHWSSVWNERWGCVVN